MSDVEKHRQHEQAKKMEKSPQPVHSANTSSEQHTLTLEQAMVIVVQHFNAGRFPEAEAICHQIVITAPNDCNALRLLGLIHNKLGRNDSALENISRAIAVKPDFAEAHNSLGVVLRQLGRLDEAVSSYQKALSTLR